jgi:hypothetical protein
MMMNCNLLGHKFFTIGFTLALNLCNDFSGCVLSTRDYIVGPSPHGNAL